MQENRKKNKPKKVSQDFDLEKSEAMGSKWVETTQARTKCNIFILNRRNLSEMKTIPDLKINHK